MPVRITFPYSPPFTDQHAPLFGFFHDARDRLRIGLFRLAILDQFDCLHQTMPRTSPITGYLSFSSSNVCGNSHPPRPILFQIVVFDYFEHCQRGRTGNRVAAKGREG